MNGLKYIARKFCGMSGYPGEYCRDGGPCDCDCVYYRKARELYEEENMKVSEKIKELEQMLEILKYERKQLHQSYIEARNRTAAEVLNILLDEPYSIYVPGEIVYEIAEKIYDLNIIDGRVSWKR